MSRPVGAHYGQDELIVLALVRGMVLMTLLTLLIAAGKYLYDYVELRRGRGALVQGTLVGTPEHLLLLAKEEVYVSGSDSDDGQRFRCSTIDLTSGRLLSRTPESSLGGCVLNGWTSRLLAAHGAARSALVDTIEVRGKHLHLCPVAGSGRSFPCTHDGEMDAAHTAGYLAAGLVCFSGTDAVCAPESVLIHREPSTPGSAAAVLVSALDKDSHPRWTRSIGVHGSLLHAVFHRQEYVLSFGKPDSVTVALHAANGHVLWQITH